MRAKNNKMLSLISFLTLAAPLHAGAQDMDYNSPESVSENPITRTPSHNITASETASDNAPSYSGGIGDDEIQYIRSVQSEYNVKLLFTEANGVYLSDLPVTIRDHKGRTYLTTVTKGPVLLVKLPAGSYIVTANGEDASREQKISVAGNGTHTYQFRFPTRDVITSENNN